jgi:hypothetical protein
VKILPLLQRPLKWLTNNGRLHQIHLNIGLKATNFDILRSYYFARLLDMELSKSKTFNQDIIDSAIKGAEREYVKVDFLNLE